MLHIKNAKIYTMAGEVLEKGDILLQDGKIKQIGTKIEAEGAEILDAKGLGCSAWPDRYAYSYWRV